MTIEHEKVRLIKRIAPHLMQMTEAMIDQTVESGEVLKDPSFCTGLEHPFGQFYAPFDWINEKADIVLIGITPGRRQAKTALKTLRQALADGRTAVEAASLAKQAASFEGEMRDIAAQLMNRFNLHELFRLRDSSELFAGASHRAHYTSLLRYPVLHWQSKKKKDGSRVEGWFDYSGGESVFSTELLRRSITSDFEAEISEFRHAWLVPFGPIPAMALERLVVSDVIDAHRVLAGLNHPSATQRNRHNCQLNSSKHHSRCKRNVGCKTIRDRSARLENLVASLISQTGSDTA